MSSLINQHWIGFDGAPVTGRAPPRLRMMAGVMTPPLMAEVAHRYQIFCLNKQAAVGDYFVSDRVLSDGSRVRLVSNAGMDFVMVWSIYDSPELELHHGLAVTAEWMEAPLHRRKSPDGTIKFAGKALQVKPGVSMTGHRTISTQVNGVDVSTYVPIVNNGKDGLWALWRHAGYEEAGGGKMPLLTRFSSGKGKYLFARMSQITNTEGDVVYEAAPVPPRYPGEPGSPYILPPCVTGDGKILAFRQRRKTVVSPTLDIWNILYGHRLLRLKDDGTFEQMGQVVTSNMTVPLRDPSEVIPGGDAGIDEPLSADLRTQYLVNVPGGGYGWAFAHYAPPYIPWTVSGQRWEELTETREYVRGGFATRDDAKGDEIAIDAFMPSPSHSSMNLCKITNGLSYPVKSIWQGGKKVIELDWPNPNYPGYGIARKSKTKRTTEWMIDATPKLKLWISGHGEVLLLEATVFGEMRGHFHETITERVNALMDTVYHIGDNGGFWNQFSGGNVGYKSTLGMLPNANEMDWRDVQAWIIANAIDFYAIAAACPPGDTVEPDEEAANAIGRYEYTSRYIIDFDSRIGLLVAIRVIVNCGDAKWKQKPGSYRGHLVQDGGDPLYTVTLALDWEVMSAEGVKTAGSKELHKSSFTKPCNEFTSTLMPNVLLWPEPEDEFRQLWMPMPPKLSPPPESYSQLDNLALHQHVVPHFAGADVIRSGERAAKAGYEPSKLKGGLIIPHKRKPTGTLYARTIKLVDFEDALWLIRKLKIDSHDLSRSIYDTPPPEAFFYAPDVGKAIEKEFRLELTEDGEHQWSDLVPVKLGVSKPKDVDRKIDVHYI